jgi:hypothetical protein
MTSRLEQRVGHRRQGGGQQHRAGHVGTPGGTVAGLRDQPGRRGEREDGDRDVDEEHAAPAPAEQVRAGEHAAEHQAQRRGEAENRAVAPRSARIVGSATFTTVTSIMSISAAPIITTAASQRRG